MSPHPTKHKKPHKLHYDMIYSGTAFEWIGHSSYKASSGWDLVKEKHALGRDAEVQALRDAGYDLSPYNHQKATSKEQHTPDAGPVPAGWYWFPLIFSSDANISGSDSHGGYALDKRQGIEAIPNTLQFPGHHRGEPSSITPSFNAWGDNRVRLNKISLDDPTIQRDGFYLHDSRKGYSHGCIEVGVGNDGSKFFNALRVYVKQQEALKKAKKPHKERLILRVKYPKDASTYGGTDK